VTREVGYQSPAANLAATAACQTTTDGAAFRFGIAAGHDAINSRTAFVSPASPAKKASPDVSPTMTLTHTPARLTALIVLGVAALHLAAAAVTPLAFDEAYYWMWSRHLAGGYLDHPPMVAVVIRLGTMLAGTSEFGIRFASILLTLPMSWAVYRTTEILFASARMAATATLLFNATMIVGVGMMIITPDAPLMAASAFVLFFLAKVLETGRGAWWLAVGAAVGVALLSKYTALFFGLQILLWLVVVPKLRRWLASPWPYAGGVVAFALFAPVLLWNANNGWASFDKQLGRARATGFTLKYIGELIPAQIAFATPLVFLLGAMGVVALLSRRKPGNAPARALLNFSFWPILLYFMFHSLHSRIEANWLAPIYPAFAIVAAVAAHEVKWSARWQSVADFSRRWALTGGIIAFILLVLQANTGILNGNARDPSVRSVGVGIADMAAQIEAARVQHGATCVIARDYGTTAWLAFYLPKSTCIAQLGEPLRWINMPPLDSTALQSTSLLVDAAAFDSSSEFASLCPGAARVAEVKRRRGSLTIETYALTLLPCPLSKVIRR